MFRRWYKYRKDDLTDGDEPDQELTYQRRTIPPLSLNGAPSSPLPPIVDTWGDTGKGAEGTAEGKGEGEGEMSAAHMEKEREAQAELEKDLLHMVRVILSHQQPLC